MTHTASRDCCIGLRAIIDDATAVGLGQLFACSNRRSSVRAVCVDAMLFRLSRLMLERRSNSRAAQLIYFNFFLTRN